MSQSVSHVDKTRNRSQPKEADDKARDENGKTQLSSTPFSQFSHAAGKQAVFGFVCPVSDQTESFCYKNKWPSAPPEDLPAASGVMKKKVHLLQHHP